MSPLPGLCLDINIPIADVRIIQQWLSGPRIRVHYYDGDCHC